MIRALRVAVTASATCLLLPAIASAGTLETTTLPAAGQGIARTADGAYWVTQAGRGTLARVTAAGDVTETAALGGNATSVGVVAGKVWATLENKKIAIVDPANPASVTTLATPANRCAPVAVVDGGNGVAFLSLPNPGSNTAECPAGAPSSLASTPSAGTGTVTAVGTDVQAFDLVVSGGFLYVPDAGSGSVRRLTLQLVASAAFPTAGTPFGIGIAPDGQIATTLSDAGQVGLVAPAAQSGTAATPLGGGLRFPFGLASVGGSLYVAENGGPLPSDPTGRLARLVQGGTPSTIELPAGAKPWRIIAGPDGSVWITDRGSARLLRYTSRPPRSTTGDAAPAATTATVAGTIDAGGNAATGAFEFGETTGYGARSADVGATGTSPAAVSAPVTGLRPSTTYHYRLVASSSEGAATGEDRTFTTPAAPAAPAVVPSTTTKVPLLGATVRFTARRAKGRTTFTRVRVSGLKGGETITVVCAGKGCPRKGRRVSTNVKKAGTLTVGASLRRAKLRKGAKLTVRVAATGRRGRVATATVGKAAPKVVRRCLAPGKTAPVSCT